MGWCYARNVTGLLRKTQVAISIWKTNRDTDGKSSVINEKVIENIYGRRKKCECEKKSAVELSLSIKLASGVDTMRNVTIDPPKAGTDVMNKSGVTGCQVTTSLLAPD